jgi:predicted NAD-dependent protein-ADP-ribosyltransferase YbiA (DUF1768 family)
MSQAVINFTYRNKDEGCLSNMSDHPVKWGEKVFSMGEAAFHYAKYTLIANDPSTPDGRKKELLSHAVKFLDDKTGPEYKSMGGKSKNGLALTASELAIWSSCCDNVQREICKWKHDNYPAIRAALRKTTGTLLVHSCRTADDKMHQEHWCGRYKEGVVLGGNVLGKIWMSIRDA